MLQQLRASSQRSWRLPGPPDVREIEDSGLLRVLVQALVIVGIMATDVAAETTNSFWAIPLSLIGSYWSWTHRRQRNTIAKFCIAAGMLIFLSVFLGRLFAQLYDSRVLLAELLIQLQILHSFDLPRRKDLGYSAVIGFILIGVAATLSQTMTFGLFLLLFLAVALPVLILDYRSRLGLLSIRFTRLGFSPKQLGLLLGVVISLGLIIFALVPRLPGYQLQTFPVSGKIEFEGDFSGQDVINPGYVREGEQGEGEGTGTGTGGTGTEFDSTFYYGFNSEINQNLRGMLEPKVVMRVRSQAPGFWRVLAFDQYTGQGWKVSRNDNANVLRRPSWSYQFLIPQLYELGQTERVIQTYSIVSEFPNLIPALTQPRTLYFPTQEIAFDPEGGLRSPVRLGESVTYTVVSSVPYRNQAQLSQAPTTYPNQIKKYYLQVPSAIQPRVRQQTEALLESAPRPLTSNYDKALYLAQTLKQRYSLQSDIPALEPDQDLVEAFLFDFEGGYPDHFATALTVMLRSIGIPARLAAGLGTGEFNPFTGFYVVKNTDAYALTEVYFPGQGWFSFDAIPGHDLFPPSVEIDQTFSVLQQFWNWVAGWLPSPLTSWLNGVFTVVFGTISRLLEWFLGSWQGLIVGLLSLTGLGFLFWLLRQGWRFWRYQLWLQQLPPMEALYQQMLTWTRQRGLGKQPQQTPLEYARQVQQQGDAAWSSVVDDIAQAYVRWRYGGLMPNLDYLQQQLRILQRSQSRNRRRSSR